NSIYGRISIGTTGGVTRVMAGDSGGTFWALNPTSFAGTTKYWSYTVASDSIQSSGYSDSKSNTVHFGTDAGKVVILNAATGVARTGYPFTPSSTTDSIRSALLYTGGILAAGTTTGKLFFIDRDNGASGPTLLRTYV